MAHTDLTWKAFEKVLVKYADASHKRVLEVGAGKNPSFYGTFQNPALGFEWHGCDMDANEGFNPNHRRCKMEDMGIYQDSAFDIIFVCHSFEHCERPIDALREFRRITRSGGLIFISWPAYTRHQILLADEDHVSVLTDMQMERLFRYTKITMLEYWKEIGEADPERDHQNSQIIIGRVEK